MGEGEENDEAAQSERELGRGGHPMGTSVKFALWYPI